MLTPFKSNHSIFTIELSISSQQEEKEGVNMKQLSHGLDTASIRYGFHYLARSMHQKTG
ncbi:hypothetical protein CTI12_AA571670 [Artemisia annua]|uniref:Uncharacterized protein n=1 Tax=Artemisia annua TaxID=35608 RepID=A0A2U1KRY4_ARTAN|nr:hypothetical protein CTI12_AA571670 [Artemisia annua]